MRFILLLVVIGGLSLKAQAFNVASLSAKENIELKITDRKGTERFTLSSIYKKQLRSQPQFKSGRTSLRNGKKIIWSIPELIGRRPYHLSEDGQILVLFGEAVLGLNRVDKKLAEVYRKGQVVKTVNLIDLLSLKKINEIKAKKKNNMVPGQPTALFMSSYKYLDEKNELIFETVSGSVRFVFVF